MVLSFHVLTIRVSQKICYNPAHTNRFFWIHLLDVQGVGIYLFVETSVMHVLSEVMKRKTVDSYYFIISSKFYDFHVLLCFEYHQKQFQDNNMIC